MSWDQLRSRRADVAKFVEQLRAQRHLLDCCAARAATQEALLGEGEASCDRCGAVEPLGRMVRVPLDERGRMLDLCRRCARGERGK